MDLIKIIQGTLPCIYDLGLLDGRLVVYLHEKVVPSVQSITARNQHYLGDQEVLFDEVLTEVPCPEIAPMTAWRLIDPKVTTGSGKGSRLETTKACPQAVFLAELFDLLHSKEELEEVTKEHNWYQALYLLVSAAPVPHSAFGVGGWASQSFRNWMQNQPEQRLKAAEKEILAFAYSLHRVLGKGYSDLLVVIGGYRAFQVSLSSDLTGSELGYLPDIDKLSSGNLHSPVDQILALMGLAAIRDKYRKEVGNQAG